jgi:hypothetical protein
MYAAQLPPLWRHGPVMVADHTRAAGYDGLIAQILAAARALVEWKTA